MIEIARFGELSNRDLFQICKLREEVFILEQNILSEAELDENDYNAIHYYIKQNNQVIAYLRVLNSDIELKIGRICTKKEYRNQGLSSKLIKKVQERYPAIVISAQEQAIPFYNKLGFRIAGSRYKEAGIWHQRMVYIK